MAPRNPQKFTTLWQNSEAYVTKLSRAENREALLSAITDFVASISFPHFIYAGFFPSGSVHKNEHIILNGYPDEWREHYYRQGFAHIDPVVSYANHHISPVNWSEASLRHIVDGEADFRVMDEATTFGLTYGWTFPMHDAGYSWSLFSIAKPSRHEFIEHDHDPRVPLTYLAVSAIHAAVIEDRYGQFEKESVANSLTVKEREVLAWAAEGKTAWETSVILRVSESTIRFHLKNASAKLGASNKAHAVAKLLLYGIL